MLGSGRRPAGCGAGVSAGAGDERRAWARARMRDRDTPPGARGGGGWSAPSSHPGLTARQSNYPARVMEELEHAGAHPPSTPPGG